MTDEQYAPLFPEVVIPGEDCLNLNVWTPDTGAAGLPVLVWIHDGSFMNGSGSVGAYDGAAFARDGVVCVTINYRLAAEGFLFLDDGIANLGLLDQLAALRWVQENIAAFGGDPGRVTVAGESAGAMSVTTLLSMPLADGLFGQAIAQSGAAAHTLTKDEGRTVAGYLADALGVPAERSALRAIPLEKLVQAAFFRIPPVRVAEARAASGAGRTWMCRFDHPEPPDNRRLGACHAVEIPFVFDTATREELRPLIGDLPSQAVADQTHRAWVDFITRGDPGWAEYDTTRRTTGVLCDTITPTDDPGADERVLWEGIR